MSREFRLRIRLGNDAMQTHEDIAAALQANPNFGEGEALPGDSGTIFDANGNTVGEWKVTK